MYVIKEEKDVYLFDYVSRHVYGLTYTYMLARLLGGWGLRYDALHLAATLPHHARGHSASGSVGSLLWSQGQMVFTPINFVC